MTPDEFDLWFRELFWETRATYRRPLVVTNAVGHIQVLMTNDTDIADAFEREAEQEACFEQFSPDG